jgi:hypothetical protein
MHKFRKRVDLSEGWIEYKFNVMKCMNCDLVRVLDYAGTKIEIMLV